MAFFNFDFIENFFFVSLGITFALIVLLVYHFKQRITSMERKGDTMYELITNVVKELQFMKKLNAYYETLFQQSTLPIEEDSSKGDSSKETTESVLQNNIVMNLVEPSSLVTILPSSSNTVASLTNSRIVVSDDESSVSDEESDSDDSDTSYSTSDEESDLESKDDEPVVLPTPIHNDSVKQFDVANDPELSFDDISTTENPLSLSFVNHPVSTIITNDPATEQPPVEMNQLMEMIQKAFAAGIAPQEPDKFAPYYEPEIEQPNSYKPVVLESLEQSNDEPIVDVLNIVETTIGEFTYETPNDVSLDMMELDIGGLDELSQQHEQPVPVIETLEPEPIVTENRIDPTPVPVIDKKQTRDVYRKMNITQLRGIATAAGITVDTTKMKKNELINLLDNLEE